MRHATADDMAAIAATCRQKIDSYEDRVQAALDADNEDHKPLYLSDNQLYVMVDDAIEQYCSENDIDPNELIPEDIIYT